MDIYKLKIKIYYYRDYLLKDNYKGQAQQIIVNANILPIFKMEAKKVQGILSINRIMI